jgi:hypothetical protein
MYINETIQKRYKQYKIQQIQIHILPKLTHPHITKQVKTTTVQVTTTTTTTTLQDIQKWKQKHTEPCANRKPCIV